jgi:decaprenyl-phosphate phosphoribosyltransferase
MRIVGMEGEVSGGERSAGGRTAGAIARELRPKQWTKNALVFAAAGAGGVLLHPVVLRRASLAFLAFCLVASAGYLVNDIIDAASDRCHPVRRERPIAAGILSVRAASLVAGTCLVVGLAIGGALGVGVVASLGVYVVLVTSYTFALKRVAVFDVAVVAACFVIRAVAGSVATGIALSQWFLILVSFGALFVVAGKRYAEFEAFGERLSDARSPMETYTASYLRYVWMLASAVAIAAYCLWAFAQPHASHHIPWSELSAIPFVLAILRYGLLLETGRGGEPEDVLLGDAPLLGLAIAWLVVYGCGVYLGR